MDIPVSLVQAYLHINGYFTVTEYPIVEAYEGGGYRSATDLDILAVRFPGAGRVVPRRDGGASGHAFETDPVLRTEPDGVDMIIGEVKTGRVELNHGARDAHVLRAALQRFGCCRPNELTPAVEALLTKGDARLASGHRIRLFAFGSYEDESREHNYTVVLLKHVVWFIRSYLREHWDILRQAEFKDPAMTYITLLEKAGAWKNED